MSLPTLSEYLVNDHLPEGYKLHGPITKKILANKLTEIAQNKPELYPQVVSNIKRVGDMFATFEGISVGLDDITPHYKERDKLFSGVREQLKKAKNKEEIIGTLVKAQNDALDIVGNQEGSLHRQVASGSRGKLGQLLKTVFSPIVAKGKGDIAQPYLITKSYSEGLSPAAFWLTAGESRRELATTQLATAIPGDTSKQISATLNSVTVSTPECGTSNGLEYDIDDHNIYDRYEAKTNKLITPDYSKSLKRKGVHTIVVRSPMTCLENPGVCQKCFGKNNHSQLHTIGTHIGLRAAQALSEPLTQMVLSAKHGGMMAHSGDTKLIGTLGFRQLVDMPAIFKDEATLSEEAGKVHSIKESPQGGSTIYIGDKEYYSNPRRNVTVKTGDHIAKGGALTDGVPNPKDVVRLRGMGAGRKYMVDTIHDIYRDSGIDMDKRHIELLVKQDLNHVRVLDHDKDGNYVKGEIIPYNFFKEKISKDAEYHGINTNILDKHLGEDFLHYTTGTKINEEVLDKLKKSKIKKIKVKNSANFEPIVRPLEQIPLLSQDWVSRLAHRHLKNTITEGAAQGWESETNGPAPYPKLIFGD